VNIYKVRTSGLRIEICQAEALKLSSQRTKFNTDRNYHHLGRRLNIICLGEILNFQSKDSILFRKVSASGRRIDIDLADAQNYLFGRQNSTLVTIIIFRADDKKLLAWVTF
jgi:hypothetical protein